MTKAVGSFQFVLQDSKQIVRYVTEREHNSRQSSQRCENKNKIYARFGKGGVISHKNAVRLRALCPKAAMEVHEVCLFLCKTRGNIFFPNFFWSQLSSERNDSEEKR